MSSVHNLAAQPHTISHSVSSHRSLQQPYSARTPGEGYPFPRLTKPRSNTITSLEKTPSQAVNLQSANYASRPTPAAQTSPKIDMDVFKQLLAMEDDTENSSASFTKGLIDLYFEDGSRTLEQMRSALTLPDYVALSRLAHFLRGSAASVGIIQVAKICESIEMRIISKREGLSIDWFFSQIQAIEEAHLSSRKWFREYFNKHGRS